MSLKAELGPELPYLRRYARALTGSQTLGDAAVRDVLHALARAPHEFNSSRPTRAELYRVFHRLWSGLAGPDEHGGIIAGLSAEARAPLLLTAVETFTIAETAEILGSTIGDVAAQIAVGHDTITEHLHSRVLIIEDEAIIALHLRSIVEDLGHTVAGVARTRGEATAMAAKTQPELVLADISLADGSSGIDTVKDILGTMDVPIIFITAFPERLLTGVRPEPTWLITKPFSPEAVAATIGQALLFHHEAAALEQAGNGGVKGIATLAMEPRDGQSEAMPRPRKPANPFRYFHSSPEVIRLVVMMYVRFPLSLRNVEDLLFERGIDICHETVRLWWNRFGPLFAADIRRQRVSRMKGFSHWRWHLDEVYVKINGEMHYLWRAVDHEGEVLQSCVTKTRDKAAALRFMRKALKRHGRAEVIVTDGLKSHPAAMRELGNEARREVGRHANNRAENSHLPFRRRERAMQRFRQMKSLQKFVSVHGSVYNHFNQERHLVDRQTYKLRRSVALAEWQNLMG